MGAYAAVMQVLGVEEDLNLLALEDATGRSLQDARLSRRRTARVHRSLPTATTVATSGQVSAERPRRSVSIVPSAVGDETQALLKTLPVHAVGDVLSALPGEDLQRLMREASVATREVQRAGADMHAAMEQTPRQYTKSMELAQQALQALSGDQLRRLVDVLETPQIKAIQREAAKAAETYRRTLHGFTSTKDLMRLLDVGAVKLPTEGGEK
jgi:hypothetical protein